MLFKSKFSSCLVCVQVKLVREVVNQMLEAWKQIPDVSDDFSPPPHSQSSSKGIYLSISGYLLFVWICCHFDRQV